MKKASLFVLCLGMAANNLMAQTARKVVFVIADGIPADVIERVHTPHLDSISALGRYIRAHVGGDKGTYTETPTIYRGSTEPETHRRQRKGQTVLIL